MPRIPENILECSVYFYPERTDAEQGVGNGGSGFLLGVPGGYEEPVQPDSYEERTTLTIRLGKTPRVIWGPDRELTDRYHLYLVTNRHVASGVGYARITTANGGTTIVPLPKDGWIFHPDLDEIAVYPVNSRYDYSRAVTFEILLTKQLVRELWVGPGDDVLMVGRFVNHEGRQRNLPSVRFGHIAIMPDEKERIRSHNGLLLEGYLVEASSFSGYSGSPVFLYTPPWELPNFLGHDPNPRSRMAEIDQGFLWLLGVNWGHLPITLDAVTSGGENMTVELNAGMMCVVPAWKLLEVLNLPELQDQRAREREAWKSEGGAILD